MKSSTIELVKWIVPFLLSITVFLRSIADGNRAKRESSSRVRQQYNSDLRKWAADCVDLLSELTRTLQDSARSTADILPELSWQISSKAFQGRFFFPNSQVTEMSRGLRPRILDWLIYAYDVSLQAEKTGDLKAAELIFKLERGFAIDMQLVLDPANLESSIEDLQVRLQADKDYMEFSQRHPVLVQAQAWLERCQESLKR